MNKKELSKYNPTTEFLLYKTSNGDVKVDVLLQNETIWMPQKKIAELFDVNVPAISKHLKNIFDNGELDKKATVSNMEIVQKESGRDVKRKTEFYNLDVIKGYTMDVERLKNPKPIFGQNYFQEQLEKIRDPSLTAALLDRVTHRKNRCSKDIRIA